MDAYPPASDPDTALFSRTWRLSGGSYPTRETLSQILEHLAPRIESLPGFRGGQILVERETGDLLATTFWATWADLEAAQAREVNSVAGVMVLTGASAHEVVVCDVLLSTPVPAVVNRALGAVGAS